LEGQESLQKLNIRKISKSQVVWWAKSYRSGGVEKVDRIGSERAKQKERAITFGNTI